MGETSFKLVFQITKMFYYHMFIRKSRQKRQFLPHQQTSSFSILHFTHCSVAFNDDIQQFMRLTKQPKIYNNFHSVQHLGWGWFRIKLGRWEGLPIQEETVLFIVVDKVPH